MEKSKVILDLDEYNELRDIKENLKKGNIVGYYKNFVAQVEYVGFYTENEVIKKFETQNNDLIKKYDQLKIKLNESEAKLTESQNMIRELRLENGKLHNQIKELEKNPPFSIRNFIFGWKKK